MTQQIDVPGVGLVEFPDSMDDKEITHAIQTNILPNYASKKTEEKQLPAKITDFSLSDWGNLAKRAISEGNQIINQGRRTPIVGPAVAAGAGELMKSVGAAGELVSDRFNPLTQAGQTITEGANEVNPVSGTVGQIGSYIAPYTAALKGVRAVAPVIPGLSRVAHPMTTLGRAGEAALAGAATGAITTPGTASERGEAAAIQGAMGAGGEVLFPWLGGVAKGMWNQYKGVEPPRMYNARSGIPDSGFPLQTNPRSTVMTPEVRQAYPNSPSVPMPGTAGEQTGARLYNYATSLRPWADLAGGSTGLPLGGMIGEIPALSQVPGFKSQGLPEIGWKALTEGFQSNKLQGLTGQGGSGLGGALLGANRQPTPGPVMPPGYTPKQQSMAAAAAKIQPVAPQASAPQPLPPSLQLENKPTMYVGPQGIAGPSNIEQVSNANFAAKYPPMPKAQGPVAPTELPKQPPAPPEAPAPVVQPKPQPKPPAPATATQKMTAEEYKQSLYEKYGSKELAEKNATEVETAINRHLLNQTKVAYVTVSGSHKTKLNNILKEAEASGYPIKVEVTGKNGGYETTYNGGVKFTPDTSLNLNKITSYGKDDLRFSGTTNDGKPFTGETKGKFTTIKDANGNIIAEYEGSKKKEFTEAVAKKGPSNVSKMITNESDWVPKEYNTPELSVAMLKDGGEWKVGDKTVKYQDLGNGDARIQVRKNGMVIEEYYK